MWLCVSVSSEGLGLEVKHGTALTKPLALRLCVSVSSEMLVQWLYALRALDDEVLLYMCHTSESARARASDRKAGRAGGRQDGTLCVLLLSVSSFY